METEKTFTDYITELEHKWVRIVLLLGIILIPLFALLDIVMMPAEKLHLFWSLRLAVTVICLIQLFVLTRFNQGRYLFLQGYLFSFVVGGMISYMTTHLGGFESSYYAGINLVIIAVCLFLPWSGSRSAINGLIIIIPYFIINLLTDPSWEWESFINNLYFSGSTLIIAVTIAYHKHRLTRAEYRARTALWGEMEIAQKIQTSLLPDVTNLSEYEVAGYMQPADEVGGDYYDVIETPPGEPDWLAVGDVAGHGVAAGLIMMMTQTSISTTLIREPRILPSELLTYLNEMLVTNISRLGEAKYLTITALRLDSHNILYAGKHQDLLIYRHSIDSVETRPTTGFWLGLKRGIKKSFKNDSITLAAGDVILLYTDGVTELTNDNEEMFGIERLRNTFQKHVSQNTALNEALQGIVRDLKVFAENRSDDLTLVLLKYCPAAKPETG